MRIRCGLLVLLMFSLYSSATGDELIEDFEKLDGWLGGGKRFPGKFEIVSDAAVGKGAIKVNFPIFLSKNLRRDHIKRADWDKKLKGMSFWVKGDGSDNWGSIVIGGDSCPYIYYFPVKNTEWRKIVIPWSDLTPQWHLSQKFNTKGAMCPSGISMIRIGNSWAITHRNKKIEPFSYCIDQLEFVEDLGDSKPPAPGTFKLRPFSEVMKKLKSGEETTVYCIGDSITAGSGLRKPNQERYAVLLQKKLREHFKNDKITVQSRAVGGAKLNHSCAWLERDIHDKTPDLITFMIGFNDKSRGFPPETYQRQLENYLERIAEKTKGKTAVLLIPTIPGKGHRFIMQDDYADVVREMGAKRGIAVCDVAKEFKKLGRLGVDTYFRDGAHPNDKGHQLFADTLFKYILEKLE